MTKDYDDKMLDQNLSRLLRDGADRPRLDAERRADILAALQAKQAELAKAKEGVVNAIRPVRRLFVWLAAAAAVVAVVAGWLLLSPAPRPFTGFTVAATGPLTRKALSDGTVVIARDGARFSLVAPRRLRLEAGDLYLLVARAKEPFVVETPQGTATARGTRFAVSLADAVRVAVAQGMVTLANSQGQTEVQAGQEGFLKSGEKPRREPAPRISYLVSWARDALAQAERLVAKDKHSTGELVAVDPWGQQVQLSLRKYHVDVHIENGIARTTVDQTFFNHMPWQTEGTFYFPLPPDASVSRLVMYVGGRLMEGGMVERSEGQRIYTEIKYQRRDPALLEMMEGNVFKMRIFPIEGRQEKRIFLSYTQKLEALYGTLRYWFPMAHSQGTARELSFHIRVKGGAALYSPQSSTHILKASKEKGDLVLDYAARDARPDQDLLLHLVPERGAAPASFATAEKDGFRYVFARLTPDLPGEVVPRPRQWIVLNDVSASRSKLDVLAQAHILDRLIVEADDPDTVSLVNLNTKAQAVEPAFVSVRDPGAKRLVAAARVDLPLGGTNLADGLRAAQALIDRGGADNPHILYLGDGVATDGQTALDGLLARIPAGATFVGIGVGKKADARLLQAAADQTGGLFTLINPDEDIDWRVFDLVCALNTPRLVGLAADFEMPDASPAAITAYPSARALADGETLFIAGRTKGALPASLVLRGRVADQPFEQRYSLAEAAADADFIPRLWAKRHIDELLKSGPEHKGEIVALSKQYYVMTPFTSLIVLENEKMYEEFKVDRGRKDHWALYPAPETIPVVQEPVDWSRWSWWGYTSEDGKVKAKADPRTVKDLVESVQFRIDAPFYYWRPQRRDQGRFALYSLLDSKADPTGLVTGLVRLAARPPKPAPASPAGPAPKAEPNTPVFADDYLDPVHEFVPLFFRPDVAGLRIDALDRGSDFEDLSNWGLDLSYRGNAYYLPERYDGRRSRLGKSYEVATEGLLGPGVGWEWGLGMPDSALGLSDGDDLSRLAHHAIVGYPDYDGPVVNGKLSISGLLPLSTVSDIPPAQGYLLGDVGLALDPGVSFGLGQAIKDRISRIDHDIRVFNTRNSYSWEDWDSDGWSYGDSIDLTKSYSGAVYGGLGRRLDLYGDRDRWTPVGQSGLFSRLVPDVEKLPPVGDRVARGRALPPALLLSYGQAVKTVAGTTAALAADFLVPRRDELAARKRSEAEDKELAALDSALADLQAAYPRFESGGIFWGYRGRYYGPQPWEFQPPQVQAYPHYNWAHDLTRYAAGLQSTTFDIVDLVAETYAAPPAGKVADDAAAAIEAARKAIGPIRIRFGKEGPALLIGPGDRFALTRKTDMSLEERMVCDGESVVHLYPELGLAARRKATALRRSALRQLAPHLVEPADWLARRFNVDLAGRKADGFVLKLSPILKAVKDIEPQKPPFHILVAVSLDGRILEKSLVVGDKVQLKLTYTYDGARVTAKWFDPAGKELASADFEAEPFAPAPDTFVADLKSFVVFDMPIRRPSYYEAQIEKLGDGADPFERAGLLRHLALANLQELDWRRWGGSNVKVHDAIRDALAALGKAGLKGELGDLVLVGSSNYRAEVKSLQPKTDVHEFHRIIAYYQALNSATIETWGKLRKGYPGSLIGHLAAYHAAVGDSSKLDGLKVLLVSFPDSPLALAAAYYAANNGNKPEAYFELFDQPRWRALAILMAAQRAETVAQKARIAEAFVALHKDLTEQGIELPVSPQMEEILKAADGGKPWQSVVRGALKLATDRDRPGPLLRFAEMALFNGERALADVAIARVRKLAKRPDSLLARLALAQAYWAGGQFKDALGLYDEVFAALEAKGVPPSAPLLAGASRLAERAGDSGRAIDLEERALAIEQAHLPELINLQAFRQRYNWLWSQYMQKIQELATTKDEKALGDWLARAERLWRTWFEVDREDPNMVAQMATLQAVAGRKEAAWLYLSTLIDEKPRDAATYGTVAVWLAGRGDRDRALGFYVQAYQCDTSRPEWLLERGKLLRDTGDRAEANRVFKEIIDGKWAPGLDQYRKHAEDEMKK